jgi:hypothetical protein
MADADIFINCPLVYPKQELLPVNGSRLFSAIMKASDIDIFSEVFKD